MKKEQRLSRQTDFSTVHREGKRFYSKMFTLLLYSKNTGPRRLGITVSKKVGNSVRRNHLKRITREAFQTLWQNFPEHTDLVLVARPEMVDITLAQMQSELNKIIQQIPQQMKN